MSRWIIAACVLAFTSVPVAQGTPSGGREAASKGSPPLTIEVDFAAADRSLWGDGRWLSTPEYHALGVRTFGGVALRAAVLALPAGSGARPAAAPPPLGEEVRGFVTRYIEAHNKGDRDAVAAMLSRQAPVSSIEMGTITRGWELIRSAAGALVGEAGTHRVSLGTLEVTPLGPEHALVVTPITIDLAAPEGDTTTQGAMTLVLSKGKSGWLVLHEHASLRFPIADFGGEN